MNAPQMNESITDVEAIEEPKMSQAQFMQMLQAMIRAHGKKCRTKGFTGHMHQPAGNKLSRKLARCGTLYGRLTLGDEMVNDIRARRFKEAKENAAFSHIQTSTKA